MKCQQKIQLYIKMPLISIVLILIHVKTAVSINDYDDNNSSALHRYTPTNHSRHHYNHGNGRTYQHIDTDLDRQPGHSQHRHSHHTRHEHEQEQNQHQRQHHQQHHQNPPKSQHIKHNNNRDGIERPWKVSLPIADQDHIADANSFLNHPHHHQHRHHNRKHNLQSTNTRLFQPYDNRRIENALNAYITSKNMRMRELIHRNSRTEQNVKLNNADSMTMAKGHNEKSSPINELQLNADLGNAATALSSERVRNTHKKPESKKITKTKRKKTPVEEDYYYYDEQENKNIDYDDDDDNEHDNENDKYNDDDVDDVEPNTDDDNENDDDDVENGDDDFNDDINLLDTHMYDDNAAESFQRKYSKGKPTRAVRVPNNDNDYVDDQPFRNGENQLEANENPVKKPIGTLTAEKWHNYGSSDVVEKSRTRYYAKESQNQLLAHYERIKREGACRMPLPKIIKKPSEATKSYWPTWTLLYRCSDSTGCCDSDSKTCTAIEQSIVDLPFFVTHFTGIKTVEVHTYNNHTKCGCVDRSQYWPNGDNNEDDNVDAADGVVAIDGKVINRTCQCPKYFNLTTTDDNIVAERRSSNNSGGEVEGESIVGTIKATNCRCDCYGNNLRCHKLKRGEEDFSLEDKGCIQAHQCTPPQCQNGMYKNGRCPRIHIRRRSTYDHHRPAI